jgi:hypothetical protein
MITQRHIPHDDRRSTPRRDAVALGPISARLLGGENVRLLDFSRRGILIESTDRLLIGAKATLRIVTVDASLMVHGRVVRSKVVQATGGGLTYHTALALDDDLSGLEAAAHEGRDVWAAHAAAGGASGASPAPGQQPVAGSERASSPGSVTGDGDTGDFVLEFLATVPHDLAELRRRASVNNW